MDVPFIILDFDGVLTSVNDTPGSFLSHGPDGYGISEPCMERLLRLIGKTGAKVVVSSNWRRFDETGPGSVWCCNAQNYRNNLPEVRKRLGGAWMGTLPAMNRGDRKSKALAEWFNLNRLDPDTAKYIIFDDQCGWEGYYVHPEFAKRCVNTDLETGLTDADCERAEALLLGTIEYRRTKGHMT
jgi:hypothetical protein